MPATRRSRHSFGPAAKGSQRTLSFGASKSSTPLSKSTKPAVSPLSTPPATLPTKEIPQEVDVGHTNSEAAVTQQASSEFKIIEKTEAEERASKVTDAQIRRYWKAREADRLALRVHQEELDVEEKILRLFDMSSQYGPCIGIARMKRWVRADKLGLQPPIEILAVLLKEEERGNPKIERAHVDELMSSKFVIGEA